MRCDLTVITATIPGREASLAKTIASVYNQFPEVEAHLIYAQSITERMPQPLHASLMQNALLPAVKTAFVMRLADDDRLLPNFTRDVMGVAQLGFDVIYSWDANGVAPRVDCNAWTEQQIFDKLCTTNFIEGSAVVMRTDLVQRMRWPTNWGRGSYPVRIGADRERDFTVNTAEHFVDSRANADDWGIFLNLARIGARFRCVPYETWQYNMGEK